VPRKAFESMYVAKTVFIHLDNPVFCKNSAHQSLLIL
jgi:hypothetical protein